MPTRPIDLSSADPQVVEPETLVLYRMSPHSRGSQVGYVLGARSIQRFEGRRPLLFAADAMGLQSTLALKLLEQKVLLGLPVSNLPWLSLRTRASVHRKAASFKPACGKYRIETSVRMVNNPK